MHFSPGEILLTIIILLTCILWTLHWLRINRVDEETRYNQV
jgi:hypothetical protein